MTHTSQSAVALSHLEEVAALARAGWMIGAMRNVRAPGMSDEQMQQRNMILNICLQLIEPERDRLMDEATKLWAIHRKITCEA